MLWFKTKFRRLMRLAAVCVLLCAAFAAGWPASAQTTPVRGEAALTAEKGYARLLVKLDEDVESEVVTAGSILVVRFKRPVTLTVDKISDGLAGYVGSARRDPDGMALRFSLSRKVTVNTMAAGERLFVDLLPEGWVGAPPPLPADVVKQLAERARNAERALRQRQLLAEAEKRPPIRVRAAVQPTFVRFTFELPDGSGVSSALNGQKLGLFFNSAYTFDLTDAKVAAPSNVSAIDQRIEGDVSAVEISVVGNIDVHTFREDKSYIVDIGFQQTERPKASGIPAIPDAIVPPQPVAAAPAAAAPVAAPATPVAPSEAKPEAGGSEASAKPAQLASADAAPASTPAAPRDVKRRSEGLSIAFPFPSPTPAALFRRAEWAWLVFDSDTPIDADSIREASNGLISEAMSVALPSGQALRLRLTRPQLLSLGGTDRSWTLNLADRQQDLPQSIGLQRNVSEASRSNLVLQLAGPGKIHGITDPDAGDSITVVTAGSPARGVLRQQDFVDFTLLETMHGVAVLPKSDDIAVDVTAGNVVVTRPGGMMMSPAVAGPERATASVKPVFDTRQWQTFQQEDFFKQRQALIAAAANTKDEAKLAARLDLARFYMARAFYPEARGLLNLALSEQKAGEEDPTTLVLHAVTSTLIGQPEQSLKDLSNPVVASSFDSQIWMALTLARQEKWPQAREKFKNAEPAITALPFDLQRIAVLSALRAAMEVKDHATAANRLNELDLIGIPADMQPAVAVLRGRLAEALGRDKDALRDYAAAMQSPNREAATDAKLRDIALKLKRNQLSDDDALKELETLSVMWRGDDLEIRTLRQLFRIYESRDRFADALAAARSATKLKPNAPASRELQDESAAMFSEVFLSPKGDGLPAIDALALFYDYRELTPIGRRGDEMIRRLAERLVNVDLLDQAADLLQYQVDHRLEGAARAHVASRLATVYLMNRKPDRALAAIRITRIADLAGELRQQRLLLEARAQSEIGRHDLALELVSGGSGREVLRLRSDIYWASRRWRESSEQIELYYGDRWRDFTPLNAIEKSDIVRAAVGYALADDAIGLARFREKYLPLMNDDANRKTFDLASQPANGSSADYAQIAKMAATVDTLEGFLRDMRVRFPETGARNAPSASDVDRNPTGSLPAIKGKKIAGAER